MSELAGLTSLSERAAEYVRRHGVVEARRPGRERDVEAILRLARSEHETQAPPEPDLVVVLAAIREFERSYGGLTLPVVGGQLAGRLTLGLCGPQPVWRTSEGRLVYRGADHDTAQCSLVLSAEGEFGSSWSGEFNPMLDSVRLVLEQVAAWAQFQGWHPAGTVIAEPESVAEVFDELTLDPDASGRLSAWWVRPDLTVVSIFDLNYRGLPHPRVKVWAPTAADAARARSKLVSRGFTVTGAAASPVDLLPRSSPGIGRPGATRHRRS